MSVSFLTVNVQTSVGRQATPSQNVLASFISTITAAFLHLALGVKSPPILKPLKLLSSSLFSRLRPFFIVGFKPLNLGADLVHKAKPENFL